MKKFLFISVLIAIFCTTLFAVDVSINLGGGYSINSGKFYLSKTEKKDSTYPKEYKVNVADVDLGVEVEFDNNLVVYDTISAGFFGDEIKIKGVGDSEYATIKTKSSLKISEAVGAGYKFHLDDFDILAGAGIKADIFNFELKENSDKIKKLNIRNFGIELNLKGSYNFDEHFAAMIAFRPALSIYDSWSEKPVGGQKIDSNGAATGYSFTAVIGAEYKF